MNEHRHAQMMIERRNEGTKKKRKRGREKSTNNK